MSISRAKGLIVYSFKYVRYTRTFYIRLEQCQSSQTYQCVIECVNSVISLHRLLLEETDSFYGTHMNMNFIFTLKICCSCKGMRRNLYGSPLLWCVFLGVGF